jgi:hypothetical protein
MTIAWWIVALVLFAAFGWLLFIVYAARRAAKSYVQPVKAEQQIKADEDDLLKLVQAQADKDKQEVENASGEDLRKLGVRRLFRIVK